MFQRFNVLQQQNMNEFRSRCRRLESRARWKKRLVKIESMLHCYCVAILHCRWISFVLVIFVVVGPFIGLHGYFCDCYAAGIRHQAYRRHLSILKRSQKTSHFTSLAFRPFGVWLSFSISEFTIVFFFPTSSIRLHFPPFPSSITAITTINFSESIWKSLTDIIVK